MTAIEQAIQKLFELEAVLERIDEKHADEAAQAALDALSRVNAHLARTVIMLYTKYRIGQPIPD